MSAGTSVRVRPEPSFRVRARRRRLRRLVPWLVVVAVLAAVAGGGAWALYRSDLLTATSIEVVGASSVSSAEVSRVAEVPIGEPLATLDLRAIGDRVSAQLPPVQSAVATRMWPHTIRITIVERVPAAVVPRSGVAPGLVAVVDRTGVIIRTVNPAPPGLPRLEVESPGPEDRRTRASLAVLDALTPRLRAELVAIKAPTPDQITLVLAKGRTVFWGGPENGERKATVATALLGRPGNVIDVSAPDVVTVR
jgi:cell division protein FtsQ